jgi:hypothetical protein
MSTTHEFDEYLETQPMDVPPFHEQMLMFEEIEADRQEKLRKEGARAALSELKDYLCNAGVNGKVEGKSALTAVLWAVNVINTRLAKLTKEGGTL